MMKRLVSMVVFSLMFLCFAGFGYADEKPIEVEAEGSYLMGDRDSRQDARQLALLEAKRAALEKAGTMLASQSKVENFELTEDEVVSQAAGRIQAEVLEEKWETSGMTMICKVRIKAKVYPSVFESQPDASQAEIQAASLKEEEIKAMDVPKPGDELGKRLVLIQNLMNNNRYRVALQDLKRLEKSYPNLIPIHTMKAKCLKVVGYPRLSLQSLVKACELGHKRSCIKVREARRAVKKVKKRPVIRKNRF